MLPRRVRDTYEVKMRKPGDRIDKNGNKKEGGETLSRHFQANNTKHAERVASKIAKKLKTVIISVSKVHPEDVIGDFKRWNLEPILGIPRKEDIILDNIGLEDILFNKKRR